VYIGEKCLKITSFPHLFFEPIAGFINKDENIYSCGRVFERAEVFLLREWAEEGKKLLDSHFCDGCWM